MTQVGVPNGRGVGLRTRTFMNARQRSVVERRALEIQSLGHVRGWSRDEIVDEIVMQLPSVSPLEAHRWAYGWTRVHLSRVIDLICLDLRLTPPHVTPSEICGWEHGRHRPGIERQDYLCRAYRTRPDRLGFGQDYTKEMEDR
jgi:hypothetical protein